jgi:hypothetical protein
MKIPPIQALALALAFNAHAVHADMPNVIASASVQQLKHVYLRCAEASSNEVLDRGTATHCSLAAEALRERGFDGSFERMLLWWQVARQAGHERGRQDGGSSAAISAFVP